MALTWACVSVVALPQTCVRALLVPVSCWSWAESTVSHNCQASPPAAIWCFRTSTRISAPETTLSPGIALRCLVCCGKVLDARTARHPPIVAERRPLSLRV